MVNILLVEDDLKIATFIKKGLEESLFHVHLARDGKEGIKLCDEHDYDLIILDVMLPELDGFDVCQTLRRRKIPTPIIMLSALDSPEEKIKGLQTGADDYLAKPFLFDELLARVQAQLRRAEFNRGVMSFQEYGGIYINVDEQNATRDGKELKLSPREFSLLLFLMKNREKALSRSTIAQAVWNVHFDVSSNTVDVYINYLRNKIDKGFSCPLIHTVKGRGYMLKMKP
ncbi:MAG: response regulator transcription factor [Bacteroidetes bacterium]|nr:response regulator transcription factor [Bacteroidota bacterium]MBS1739493.1 response regulator transcription factor [Bacteroidota bacterium]